MLLYREAVDAVLCWGDCEFRVSQATSVSVNGAAVTWNVIACRNFDPRNRSPVLRAVLFQEAVDAVSC